MKRIDKRRLQVFTKRSGSRITKMLHESGQLGIIISVTKVTVTTDLSLSKVYTSVFPAEKSDDIVKELNELKPKIKHQIAQKTKHQLRKMPDLAFYNDDSLEYITNLRMRFR